MKKVVLSLGLFMLCSGVTMAQGKKNKKDKGTESTTVTTAPAPTISVAPTAQTSLTAENMAFKEMTHDFGTVPEGPDATVEFVFTNTGKEPIIIEKAQPSCGCTVPSFPKEPIMPGSKATINVAYHSKGRPGAFTKNITVVSNAGTKMLTIKGNVEKAPTSSVPENTSMLKTN
jgi:hypothetical protein